MNKQLFEQGLSKLELEADSKTIEKFVQYSELLKEWNEKINLTAITDDDGITIKHFLDSVLPLKIVDIENQSLADIGTGAGFPGLPLKLLRPDIKLTLIDSLNKRIKFLEHVCDELEIDDVVYIHGRAEELGRKELRESFDIVVSRAVANMTALSEYCLPFVKPGGKFIALKAQDSEAEISAARSIIGNLGGKITEMVDVPVPLSDITRTLIIIEKIKPTPKVFPRTAKKIKQSGK